MSINVTIMDYYDNRESGRSSRLRIENGKMTYFEHDLGPLDSDWDDGRELEMWDEFDEENTQKFLRVLGIADADENIIKETLAKRFSQRPSEGVFDQWASRNFKDFVKEHDLKYISNSWSSYS